MSGGATSAIEAADWRRPAVQLESDLCTATRTAAALIGCVIAEPRRFLEVAHVKPEHFADPGLGAAWRALASVLAKGDTPDPATVLDSIGHLPEVVAIGGAPRLFDVFDKAGDPALARQHAATVVEAYARREGSRLCSQSAKSLLLQGDASAPALISELRQSLEALERGACGPEAGLQTASEATALLLDSLDDEATHGRPKGVMTGLRCFDRRLRGLRPGHLLVIGGRPSMGKTALMRAAAYGAAARSPDKAFLIFSLEMGAKELAERAISAASFRSQDCIPYCEIGSADADQRLALRSLRASMPCNVLIDDRGNVGLDEIARRVWSVRSRRPVGGIFIDYLQLLRRPAFTAGRTESLILGEITRGLKVLAKDAETAVVLLSQLNRAVENRDDKRPQLSDLRESGSIEQDADAVLFPFRAVYYMERSEPLNASQADFRAWQDRVEINRRRMDVIAAKVRGGAVGTDRQTFFAEYDHVEDFREDAR